MAFVPNRSYSGTVDIGFTGYDTKGNSFSGTVTILNLRVTASVWSELGTKVILEILGLSLR